MQSIWNYFFGKSDADKFNGAIIKTHKNNEQTVKYERIDKELQNKLLKLDITFYINVIINSSNIKLCKTAIENEKLTYKYDFTFNYPETILTCSGKGKQILKLLDYPFIERIEEMATATCNV